MGADGMFLWARLMMTCLSSTAFTSTQWVDIIMEVTLLEGLEKMYDRIVEVISKGNQTEIKLAAIVALMDKVARSQ